MSFAESVLEETTFLRLEGLVPESRNCTAPRETPLPKLISGELRLKDAAVSRQSVAGEDTVVEP